ncbi:MAG TPA: adenosylhomocysteinase [Candidatus Thermoplasmatota archaeon]|jgi:adenosylhomocysteinase|nr:adenosylhomocysteinase [Candidatus Thermoplasmatota archaeon]
MPRAGRVKDARVKDMALAPEGAQRIAWAEAHMPVLMGLRKDFARSQPLQGVRLAACLHVTKETAVLARTLQAGGAEVALCGSNPLSTQDDVAAALVQDGIKVFAARGVDDKTYYRNVDDALATRPHYTMDDGGDLVTRLHTERKEWLRGVRAGTEETTTGVTRFRAMARDGVLKFPIVAINDALTKHLFDNRYGTGQSTLDGILRATSVLLAGKTVVVAGYGWCGRGLATRARGMGSHVVVTEVDPVKALEAVMDGFQVMSSTEAAKRADIVITVTGNKNVVSAPHFKAMKDGAILANSGHFDAEIDLPTLRKLAKKVEQVKENVQAFRLKDGRTLYLIGEGRLVNLAAAEGHPPEVMDMSFANQALAVRWLSVEQPKLEVAVHAMPAELDQEVARRKLAAMRVEIDALSAEQARYMSGWREGT